MNLLTMGFKLMVSVLNLSNKLLVNYWCTCINLSFHSVSCSRIVLLCPPLEADLRLMRNKTMTTPSSINTMGTATAIPMHAGPQDAGSSAGTGAGVLVWLLMATV